MKKLFLTTILLLFSAVLVFAEIPIYCPHCKRHLYNYQKDEIKVGDELKAEDFKPASEDVPQPKNEDAFVCPIDNCPMNQYESWAWEQKAHPPVFHIWAVSLLTKDKEGNWLGVPYNITIEDWERK
ncbi:MAG: hypothetical protein QME16_00180 [Planctomycetota bacterium]|nr:hypothetical protein [Planctomycetota bacterium]